MHYREINEDGLIKATQLEEGHTASILVLGEFAADAHVGLTLQLIQILNLLVAIDVENLNISGHTHVVFKRLAHRVEQGGVVVPAVGWCGTLGWLVRSFGSVVVLSIASVHIINLIINY